MSGTKVRIIEMDYLNAMIHSKQKPKYHMT